MVNVSKKLKSIDILCKKNGGIKSLFPYWKNGVEMFYYETLDEIQQLSNNQVSLTKHLVYI